MRAAGSHVPLALALGVLACSPPASSPPLRWSVAHEEPSAALLTVLPVDGGRVLVAGADDGSGPCLLRGDASGLARVPVGARGALWWLARDGDGVLGVGEHGLMVALATPDADPEVAPAPTDRTLFGAWVAADGTAWAVGGDVLGTASRGTMLVRRDGAWQPEDRIEASLLDPLLFKVWGRNERDVWAAGDEGLALHFDGSRWSRVETGTRARLTTVHGADDDLFVVGGTGNAILLTLADGALADQAPPFLPPLNGVFALGGGAALAVGDDALILERRDGTWTEDLVPSTSPDLHAVASDARGEAWAVGGALFSPAFDRGVVLRGVH